MGKDSAYPYKQFSVEDIERLKPSMKVGVLGTVTPEGLPHLTLISTLMASSPEKVVWGQFMEGFSKQHIQANPKAGFLVMSLDRVVWRGKANFTHTSKEGPDFDFYNNSPLFRYNAYFGVHTVYYMDLVAQSGPHPLPMNQIIYAAIKTMIARTLTLKHDQAEVFNPWTHAFFNKLGNLKFLSYIDAEGYPVIIPLIQAQALDHSHLVFSTGAFGSDLKEIPAHAPVCVFGMSLSMEDVLTRGIYQGQRRLAGLACGVVEVDWVYNPMPPAPIQIYPKLELKAITEFD